MSGVARAQGSQEKVSVKKSEIQLWCMPSAYIEKTVCTPSKVAKPSHGKAIHFHESGDRVWRVSIMQS
jgi:hypothetical protein